MITEIYGFFSEISFSMIVPPHPWDSWRSGRDTGFGSIPAGSTLLSLMKVTSDDYGIIQLGMTVVSQGM